MRLWTGRQRISSQEGVALFFWVLASFWSLRITIGAASRVADMLASRLLAGGLG